jgi:hypothetical protein
MSEHMKRRIRKAEATLEGMTNKLWLLQFYEKIKHVREEALNEIELLVKTDPENNKTEHECCICSEDTASFIKCGHIICLQCCSSMVAMDVKRNESFPCPVCRVPIESKELYAEPFGRFMGTSVYWCFRQVNISLVTLKKWQ